VVTTKCTIFWDVTPCFGGTYCLCLQGLRLSRPTRRRHLIRVKNKGQLSLDGHVYSKIISRSFSLSCVLWPSRCVCCTSILFISYLFKVTSKLSCPRSSRRDSPILSLKLPLNWRNMNCGFEWGSFCTSVSGASKRNICLNRAVSTQQHKMIDGSPRYTTDALVKGV
jgi:hypothetical protein